MGAGEEALVSWAERRLLGRCCWEKEKGERAGLRGCREKEKGELGWADAGAGGLQWVGLVRVLGWFGFLVSFSFYISISNSNQTKLI